MSAAQRKSCKSCGPGKGLCAPGARSARTTIIRVPPLQPRTTGTLQPGDIVWTAFTGAAGADGEDVAQLLTTAPLTQGTSFGLLRAIQDQSPVTAVPHMRVPFTLTQDLPIGTTLRVHVALADLELRLVDGVTVVATATASAWPVSPQLSNVYVFAELPLRFLHAVGIEVAVGGSIFSPVFGPVAAPYAVVLPPIGGTTVYAAINNLRSSPPVPNAAANDPVFVSPTWSGTALQQYIMNSRAWRVGAWAGGLVADARVARNFALLPKPGAVAFVGVYVGDAFGPSAFRVALRQDLPAATALRFTTDAYRTSDGQFTTSGFGGGFTYTTPSTVLAAGTVLQFELYLAGGITPTVDVAVRPPGLNTQFAPLGVVSGAAVNDVRAMTQWSVYVSNAADDTVAVISQIITSDSIPTTRPTALWSPDIMNQAVWPPRSIIMLRAAASGITVWGGPADRELLSAIPQAGSLSNSVVFVNPE